MRFHTHNRTPKIKMPKLVLLMCIAAYGLLLALFVFTAIVCSIYANSVDPAVLILTPVLILTALFLIMQKDMERAYIEINDDTIRAVDYYFGMKKEKSFLIQDIANAQIVHGYSMRVHGYRYSMCGSTYIVFRDSIGKYLFKVLCVPETKQFFDNYINQH